MRGRQTSAEVRVRRAQARIDVALDGFVPTPPELAARLVREFSEIGALEEGSWVLEPSAGEGPIVEAVLAANPGVQVAAIEPNPGRAQRILARPEVDLTITSFEAFQASREFDAIVMNPPFATAESRTLWIDHLWRAWELVRADGWVTCIAPTSLTWRQDRRHRGVRQLVERHGSFEELDAKAFPIGVRVGVLQLRRPLLFDELTQALAESA